MLNQISIPRKDPNVESKKSVDHDRSKKRKGKDQYQYFRIFQPDRSYPAA
jgi:hypothetical protein